jgi:glutathione S-transferase
MLKQFIPISSPLIRTLRSHKLRKPARRFIKTAVMSSVDTSIHDSTSGLAYDTSSAHASDEPLKLYSGWFCPFVQRAWITLQEKKIPYQYIEINPYHKEKSFLELNPRGLVPTLRVPVGADGKDAKPLYESTVICEYLDEVYSEKPKFGEPLFPEDPYLKARARIWIDFVGSRVVPAFYLMLQHTPEKEYSIDDARKELLGHIKTITLEADPEGPFFLGETMSMVDVSVAPWMLRLFLIDHYKPGGVGIPSEGEDKEVWERWRKWEQAVKAKKSVQETMSDRKQYIDVYKRYSEDTTQSGVGKATRGGRELP